MENNKKSVSEEIDKTIVYLCNRIRNTESQTPELVEIVSALASLVEAKAKIINYCRP